ncbi:MAG: hypothetical protein DMD49_08480 [Gemmatimonadetes bacterium]|nr:MAG: hypothetical protein DMD28_01625 [Gemmatimonadota bacterium]PYP31274.1 MAG: hypothetical protein DMD49_08480 [Gemmatimonadota bacterium]
MRSRLWSLALALGFTGLTLLAACNTSPLPPAAFVNVIDTVTLYALDGTPLGTPSAYSMNGRRLVRTETSIVFDFAFNFDSLGRPVFLPSGAIRLGTGNANTDPGFQSSSATFANVTIAPTDGYEADKPFLAVVGNVTVARSRVQTCADGNTLPLYAKLQVLAVDVTARTIQFQILVNQNCAYLGLAPGIPDR